MFLRENILQPTQLTQPTMNINLISLSLFLFIFSCTDSKNNGDETTYLLKMINQVDFSNIRISDDFWSPRLKSHVTVTLPVCIDQIENKTGRIRNFENAAKGSGEHSGIFYDDSDVYKALEGKAYSLINNPNTELEKNVMNGLISSQQHNNQMDTLTPSIH